MVIAPYYGAIIAPSWCNGAMIAPYGAMGVFHWLFPPEVGRTDKMLPGHKHIDRTKR